VPNVARYKFQPSTKLFEYWSWGLPIIGSSYFMNEKYFEEGLGILYPDSEAGIEFALDQILNGLSLRSRDEIVLHSRQFSWANIVENILEPLLQKVASSK